MPPNGNWLVAGWGSRSSCSCSGSQNQKSPGGLF
jgi:hypothetical protein